MVYIHNMGVYVLIGLVRGMLPYFPSILMSNYQLTRHVQKINGGSFIACQIFNLFKMKY